MLMNAKCGCGLDTSTLTRCTSGGEAAGVLAERRCWEMKQCLSWLHLWSHGHNNITSPTINYPNTLFNGHQLLKKPSATPLR